MRVALFVIAVQGVVSGGCKGTPSCEDAIRQASKNVPELAAAKAMSEAVAECIKDKWPDELRNCVAGARDAPDLVACMMRAKNRFGESKVEIAKMTVQKYAFEAYPSWAQAHPDKACPDRLEDLNEYMTNKDTRDPWGGRYRMLCGSNQPAGAKGLAVVSPGEDGKEGTADDIKSE